MTISTITERLNQEPFRPFALETMGGSWIDVLRREAIAISPYQPARIVIFDEGGAMFIYEPDEISGLQVK
jgi:hypothetical protein